MKRLYERGDRSRIQAAFVDKVERILARVDAATVAEDCDAPGFGLHALRGDLSGFWAITVSRNWRVIFRFENGNAFDVDLVDYH
ncbi:MAG: type II toxin-antitoxin system RelE/ParE family toxin [Bauldia sp.]